MFSCASDLVENCSFFPKMFILHIFVLISISSTAISATQNAKIIGGSWSKNGEYPFMASLQYNTNHICGGSIISEYHVLTAAHCLIYENGTEINSAYLNVMVGRNELRSNSFASYRRINKVIIHPKHKNFDYDIAILELNIPLPIGHPNVSIVNLGENPVNGTNCTIAGWGHDAQNKSLNNHLNHVNVTIMNNKTCYHKYAIENITILPDIICAGDNKTDSCQGDSGGPMICNNSLSGIISSGVGCAHDNFPGLYTSVEFHRKWIEEAIKNHTKSTIGWMPPILVPSFTNPVNNTNQTGNGTLRPIGFYPPHVNYPPHPPHIPYPPPKRSGESNLKASIIICLLSLLLIKIKI